MGLFTGAYGGATLAETITVNDVLETLIGDLPTTEEPHEKAIVQRTDGSWLIDAMTPFDEVLQLLELSHGGTGFAEGDFKTITRFYLKFLGNIPSIGARFVWRDVHIEIVDMDGRRIERILVEGKVQRTVSPRHLTFIRANAKDKMSSNDLVEYLNGRSDIALFKTWFSHVSSRNNATKEARWILIRTNRDQSCWKNFE